MGIDAHSLTFLVAARRLGVSYERTLTIGRQSLLAGPGGVVEAFADAGSRLPQARAEALVGEGGGFVEPLLREMGAREADALDASDFEGASVVHDLNRPLPADLRGRYTVVLDGGSLEHVFDFPTALAGCMDAVAPGGHLLLITPANNYFGHGFYQFSPELFYRALAPARGFCVVDMFMRPERRKGGWRRVSDPARVGARVTLTSPWPAMLFVVARRIEASDAVAAPQQSDYAALWSGQGAPIMRYPRWYETASWNAELMDYDARRWVPERLRPLVRVADMLTGTVSQRSHFERVEMATLTSRDAKATTGIEPV